MNVRSAAPPRLALSIEAGGRDKAETRPLVDVVARRRREHGQRRLKVQGLRLLVAVVVLTSLVFGLDFFFSKVVLRVFGQGA